MKYNLKKDVNFNLQFILRREKIKVLKEKIKVLKEKIKDQEYLSRSVKRLVDKILV